MVLYDLNSDVRFQKTFDEQYIELLNKHGFDITPEQEKDIHKLGESIGEELNYYKDSLKQLFQQSKLRLANGGDLDTFGIQFNTPRNPGEGDEAFRIRLQAVFSPRKVTKPHIELVLEQFSGQVSPEPILFEPWRFVLKFDDVFPYDYRMDTGPWYMWSPDYWRSGTLILKSGLSNELYGVVEELVNAGIKVLYEQESSDTVEDDSILPVNSSSTVEDNVFLGTKVFDRFYFDIISEGFIDDPLSKFDVGDFTLSPSSQNDNLKSTSYFSISPCLKIPEINLANWDTATWGQSQWFVDNNTTPLHESVSNSPWFQFDTVDPGAFLSNENSFQFDFSSSSNLDIQPNNSSFDNDSVVINNDQNIMDSTEFVITGWEVLDTCEQKKLSYHKFSTFDTQNLILNYNNLFNYILIEDLLYYDDSLNITESILIDLDYSDFISDSLILTSQAGMEIDDNISDVVTFLELISPEDRLLLSDSVSELVISNSGFSLGDNKTLGDNVLLYQQSTITLNNLGGLTLNEFIIE